MPSSGDLRERVRFEKRSGASDGCGIDVPGPFVAEFTQWAMFLMTPGSEAKLASRLQGGNSNMARGYTVRRTTSQGAGHVECALKCIVVGDHSRPARR